MESLSTSRSIDEKEQDITETENVSIQLSFSSVYRIKAIMNCNAIMNGFGYLAL